MIFFNLNFFGGNRIPNLLQGLQGGADGVWSPRLICQPCGISRRIWQETGCSCCYVPWPIERLITFFLPWNFKRRRNMKIVALCKCAMGLNMAVISQIGICLIEFRDAHSFSYQKNMFFILFMIFELLLEGLMHDHSGRDVFDILGLAFSGWCLLWSYHGQSVKQVVFEAGICVFVIQCIRILSKFDRREHKVSSI